MVTALTYMVATVGAVLVVGGIVLIYKIYQNEKQNNG